MDYRQVVATNLRRIRGEKGFTQEDLAHDAGVSRPYMSKLETGKTYIGLEILVKFGEVLGVEPAEFLKPTRRARKK
jgi:transcriptional regulator with XRE-family HTH domain